MSMSARRNQSGFTLVELLVVIGIIALLISILLPSLAAARKAAGSIACQANLRSIGQALVMYNNESRKMPWGYLNVTVNGVGYESYWTYALSETMAAQGDPSGTYNHTSKVFRCPEALIPDTALTGNWRPISHYIGNWRAFPYGGHDGYYEYDFYPDGQGVTAGGNGVKYTTKAHQRGLESISNSTSVALVMDGSQIEARGWNAQPTWRWTGWMEDNPPFGIYPSNNPTWLESDYDRPFPLGVDGNCAGAIDDIAITKKWNVEVPIGFSADGSWATNDFTAQIRYRHGSGANVVNILWADGHVDSRKLGELRFRDVCMNYR